MSEIKITASDAATSETAERSNAVKKTDGRKAKKKIAFLESIISDIREKYNCCEIPRNSEDSRALARARGEIDRMIDWRTYALTEHKSARPKGERRRSSQKVIVPPDDTKEILELRINKRMSYEEIAKEVGYSRHIVRNCCVEHGQGGIKRKRKIDPERAEKMFNDGMSYREISEQFHCTAAAVAKALQEWRLEHEPIEISDL